MTEDFKGVWIPKEVWQADDLSLMEKHFLAEILSLDNEHGCYANNDHFAKFFGVSKTQVSVIINSLVKKGYIKSDIEEDKGNRRTLRGIKENFKTPSISKPKDPIKENLNTSQSFVKEGLKENFKHSNTFSNTSNNTIEKELEAAHAANLQLSENIKNLDSKLTLLENQLLEEKKKKEKPPQVPRDPPQENTVLFYPFDSQEFKAKWKTFENMKKQKSRPIEAKQAMLMQLAEFDEEFAIGLLMKAIAGNYQGLVFNDTKEAYERYIKSKNGQSNSNQKNSSGINLDALAAIMRA